MQAEGVVTLARPKAVRRITVDTQARLDALVDVMSPMLPLTSRSKNTTTFKMIFADSGVESYLGELDNKKQALRRGLTEVYRRHQRLPYSIVRRVVPAAIGYRRYKRDPLTRAELDRLADCLDALGVNMRTELADTELDETLPRVTVPPQTLKKRLREHDLEPALASEPLDLFDEGHFNEAVRKAERFEDRVRELSGLDEYGRDLMAHAFADDSLLDVDRYAPENRRAFQEGYKFLAMGTMSAVRNVFSHGDEERRSPEECFENLMLLNWLFRVLKT